MKKIIKENFEEESSKQEKMKQVAASIFNLLINFNLEDVNYARVSRLAKVSRPWLYKYVGANKNDLIHFAINHLGKQLTEADRNEVITSKEEFVAAIVRGMDRMFDNAVQYPSFIPVYFKFKGTNTVPGRAIDTIEQAYIQRQADLLLSFNKSFDRRQAEYSAELLTSFRMALAFNWQQGQLKNKATKDEVLKIMNVCFSDLFGVR